MAPILADQPTKWSKQNTRPGPCLVRSWSRLRIWWLTSSSRWRGRRGGSLCGWESHGCASRGYGRACGLVDGSSAPHHAHPSRSWGAVCRSSELCKPWEEEIIQMLRLHHSILLSTTNIHISIYRERESLWLFVNATRLMHQCTLEVYP